MSTDPTMPKSQPTKPKPQQNAQSDNNQTNNDDDKKDDDVMTIKKFDASLEKYYAKYNKTYKDSDGIGKFEAFCTENAIDDDQFVEEMQGSIDDCMLTVDFDDDFPCGDPLNPRKATNEDIFIVFKKIYNGETDILALIRLPKVDWKFAQTELDDKKYMANIWKRYKLVCPISYDRGLKNEKAGLMRALAVGIHINFPYLQYIVDMYDRECVTNKPSTSTGKAPRLMNSDEWASNNKHIKSLISYKIDYLLDEQQPYKCLCSALKSYPNRIRAKFKFKPGRVIVDSLDDVAHYMEIIFGFVDRLIQKNQNTCPFQFDFCFAFNETERRSIDDDDDDKDDDDDDDFNMNAPVTDKDKDIFYDCLGNIKEKIKSNDLFHQVITNIHDDYGKDYFHRHTFENDFQRKIEVDKYKSQYGTGIKNRYPRGKRFCAIIDRRKPNQYNTRKVNNVSKTYPKGTIDDDELIVFEPPISCNTLADPDKIVPEFYFDATKTCIIPAHLSDDNKANDDKHQTLLNQKITSLTDTKGSLLTLSFHAISSEEVRCYLYHNKSVTRFYPNDIITVLPFLFQMNDDNKTFIKELAPNLVSKIKPTVDYKFENFYTQFSHNKPDWKHIYNPQDDANDDWTINTVTK